MEAGWMVAVSYLEWIRWVATTRLRTSGRIAWMRGSRDQEGFDALMDRAPDLKPADDGFLVARLVGDGLRSAEVVASLRGSADLWLELSSVAEFHPLSERGRQLLEADAERACVRLGAPIFESVWAEWVRRAVETAAARRGALLCRALGLPEPRYEGLDPSLRLVLTGRQPPPNHEKSREQQLGGTRAFGWAAAIAIARETNAGRAVIDGLGAIDGLRALVRDLKGRYDHGPMLDGSEITRRLGEIERALRQEHDGALPLVMSAVALHYREGFGAERPVELESLVRDLATIASESPALASLCADSIGREMEDVAVASVIGEAHHERFAVKVRSESEQLKRALRLWGELRACEAQSREAEPTGDLQAGEKRHGDSDSQGLEPSLDADGGTTLALEEALQEISAGALEPADGSNQTEEVARQTEEVGHDSTPESGAASERSESLLGNASTDADSAEAPCDPKADDEAAVGTPSVSVTEALPGAGDSAEPAKPVEKVGTKEHVEQQDEERQSTFVDGNASRSKAGAKPRRVRSRRAPS